MGDGDLGEARGGERPLLDAEERCRLLLEISQRTRGTLELDVLLSRLLDAASGVLPYDAAGFFVLRENLRTTSGRRGALIAGLAERGFERRAGDADPMLDFGHGIVGHVIRTGESVVAPDVERDPRYVVGRRATASEIAVPILLDGRVVGALNLESDRRDGYGEADLEPLRFFAEAAAIALEKAILHRRLLAMREVEAQLRTAQEVQARLLPPAPPQLPGYDLAGRNLSSSEIGGDYFDFLPLAPGVLGLALADVAGKGIPAALVMATFRAFLRTEARRSERPSEVVAAVHALLRESSGPRAFVTGFFGRLELVSGELTYANAGHPPPLLLRQGDALEPLSPTGPLLGSFPDAVFDQHRTRLAPGDLLLLYTDGVVEALGRDDEQFGSARLAEALRAASGAGAAELVERILAATRAFAGRADLADDVTLVAVRRR